MHGKNRSMVVITFFQVVLAGYSPGYAQEWGSPLDQAEEILNRDESAMIPEEVCEERQDLALYPVNLNKATREELLETGLFTSFQVHMIIKYRETYGELLSIFELASITGFRATHLKEISSYLTVVSSPRAGYQKSTGNRILLFAGRAYPDAIGYTSGGSGNREPVYKGSPWKTSLRVKGGLGNRTSFGVAYEKDPGETVFSSRYRPEYVTGYFRYQGHRILEQAILGSYRIHLGMGLIQGAGFFHAPQGMHSRPIHLSSLKPYAGISESGLHRGLALKLKLSPVTVTVWSSLRPMDLSYSGLLQVPGEVDWVSYFRESGLHRTPVERNGRNLGYLANGGIQAMINYNTFHLGIQLSAEISGLTEKGEESLQMEGKPTLLFSTGIHWRWQSGRLETYGEYSPGNLLSTAILSGARFHLSDFLTGGVQLHYYGPSHRETFSSAYASGSHISNEKGVMLHLYSEPTANLVAGLSVELFSYPSPRYLTHVPSSGFRFNCTLQNSGTGKLHWRIGVLKKLAQQTPEGGEQGIRIIIQKQLTRFDGRIVCQPAGSIQWQSRLVASFVSENGPVPGYAAIQQVAATLGDKMRCTLQFVVFNISHWDNRIYLYEPGLYHQFNFPVYYGEGQKFTMVCAMKPGKRITLEGKVSLTTYHDRDHLGSGDALVEGFRKLGTGLQLVMKL